MSTRIDSFGGERRALTGAGNAGAHISTYQIGGSSSEDDADEDAAFLYTSVDARRHRALMKKRLCVVSLLAIVCAGGFWLVHRNTAAQPPATRAPTASPTASPTALPVPVTAAPSPPHAHATAPVPTPRPRISNSTGPTLYCFIVSLPFGYEIDLLREQYKHGVSIFQCNAHTVFSNETFHLGGVGSEATVKFEGDMKVSMNSWTWEKYGVKLALNTDVFNRVWRKVWSLGLWREYDWTIKTEADTVFFPGRLQDLLTLQDVVPAVSDGAGSVGPVDTSSQLLCGNCSKEGSEDEACASHVQWVQGSGIPCSEALARVAQLPPDDCGCVCHEDACKNANQVYLRNCATNYYDTDQTQSNKALHGPLEVLSKAAVATFSDGLGHCEDKLRDSFGQWGEDWFLEHCLTLLGINPVDSFRSLVDGDCDPEGKYDGSCKHAAAAFQPKKTADDYFSCLDEARSDGKWPPSDLNSPAV